MEHMRSLYSEQLQGDQTVIKQIIKANYTSFELHISGAGMAVQETIPILTADFPVERDIDVVDDIFHCQQNGLAEFERAYRPNKSITSR